MSNINTLLNSVIALLENRPKDAREMLREGVREDGAVLTRLMTAIRKRETAAQVRVLKQVLTDSLRIDSGAADEAYLQGVEKVEGIIDEYIISLDNFPTLGA